MKLVRDGTEARLANRDPRIVFDAGAERLRDSFLVGKMLEEVSEYLIAETREQVLAELGDMQELIWAMAKAAKISEVEVVTQAAAKRAANGEFDKLRIMKVQTSDERPPLQVKINEEERHDYAPVTSYSQPDRSFRAAPCYSG